MAIEVIEVDFRRAYFLGRVGLGINIALHGWSRIPKFGEFVAHTLPEFSATFLPATLVKATCYGIVFTESTVGLLLLLGWWTRLALSWGAALLWLLLFGTCLTQNWSNAGDQLIYLAFFIVLLAFASYNYISIDTWREGRSRAME
jgi:thiosulfate dehydrogenase [quinone] large subunit